MCHKNPTTELMNDCSAVVKRPPDMKITPALTLIFLAVQLPVWSLNVTWPPLMSPHLLKGPIAAYQALCALEVNNSRNVISCWSGSSWSFLLRGDVISSHGLFSWTKLNALGFKLFLIVDFTVKTGSELKAEAFNNFVLVYSVRRQCFLRADISNKPHSSLLISSFLRQVTSSVV